MKELLLLLSFFLISSVLHGQSDGLLKKYQWKNRVILLFASGQSDALLQKQQKIFREDSAGMDDRDLIVKVITPDSPEEWKVLSQKLDAGGPFSFLLIGKDGGVKKRSDQPVSLESLYSLIDSMPMRQSEMRRRDQ